MLKDWIVTQAIAGTLPKDFPLGFGMALGDLEEALERMDSAATQLANCQDGLASAGSYIDSVVITLRRPR
jgi:hypothetical protein